MLAVPLGCLAEALFPWAMDRVQMPAVPLVCLVEAPRLRLTPHPLERSQPSGHGTEFPKTCMPVNLSGVLEQRRLTRCRRLTVSSMRWP